MKPHRYDNEVKRVQDARTRKGNRVPIMVVRPLHNYPDEALVLAALNMTALDSGPLTQTKSCTRKSEDHETPVLFTTSYTRVSRTSTDQEVPAP
jgi:hypothetical protein